jgi:hypothetical protein
MNTTTDRDNEKTVFQSSHREWVEDQELRQQERDQRAVELFLRSKLQSPTNRARTRVTNSTLCHLSTDGLP